MSVYHFFLLGSVKRHFTATMRFGHSRSSKVIDFGTYRNRVCDFLLVRHSNLGPILHRFRDIAGFVLMTPPLFHPNFGSVPVASGRPCWGQPEHKPYAKPWNYFWSIPTYVPAWASRTDWRTDRQTDDTLRQNRALRSIARQKRSKIEMVAYVTNKMLWVIQVAKLMDRKLVINLQIANGDIKNSIVR